MIGANFLKAELARIAYLDGGKEGISGAMGCAFAIRNRVRAGFYNGSWSQVLSNHRQYSASLEPYPDTIPDPNTFLMTRLLQEIDGVFDGNQEDNVTIASDPISSYMKVGAGRVGDLVVSSKPPVALYYGYADRLTNPWFVNEIAGKPEQHRVIATVAGLFFWS